MKKLLLLVLAFGMFVSAFAQPEVSDKWVITPVTTMKGVLGRLDINFPADIERNILIYQQADNKFLRSVSRNDNTYTIAPGEYRFTLTNVPVENVPIKKGHETRLKAGFLDIVSEGHWHLYDETKEKAYTSDNKPKKLALPVGRYQIKLGGQFYPVIIKDGETVEDYTPVEVKDKTPGQKTPEVIDVSASAQPEVPKKNTESSDKWVITPLTTMKGVLGRLDINFPADIERNILIYQQADNKFLRSVSRNDDTYTIAPGEYRFTLTNVPVENVPIKKGHETRLKAGFLDIVSEGDWHLYDETKEKAYTSGNIPKKLALPVGRYQIKLGGQFYPVIIKDGETVEDSSPLESNNDPLGQAVSGAQEIQAFIPEPWTITPHRGSGPVLGKEGRLDLQFPTGNWNNYYTGNTNTSWYVNIATGKISNGMIFSNGWPFTGSERFRDSLDIVLSAQSGQVFYPLSPGLHQVKLNNIYIKDLPIEEGKTTRLKSGLVRMSVYGMWFIYEKEKGWGQHFLRGMGGATFVLPVGVFGLKVWGSSPYDQIKVKDGEETIINIPYSAVKITATFVKWNLYDANGFPTPYYSGGRFDEQFRTDLILTHGNYIIKYQRENEPKDQHVKTFTIPDVTGVFLSLGELTIESINVLWSLHDINMTQQYFTGGDQNRTISARHYLPYGDYVLKWGERHSKVISVSTITRITIDKYGFPN